MDKELITISKRLYKCPVCEEKDYEANMVIDFIGKQKKRFHKGCHVQHLEEKKFKQQEGERWKSCYETIKKVCGLTDIPQSHIGLVQRLRNGDPVMGMRKEDVRRFKEGFTYPVIEQTYLKHADLIQWKKSQWNGNTSMFLQYVLTYYIRENIEDVNEEVKRKKEQERRLEHVDQDMDFDIGDKVTYKQQDDEMDISKFL